MRSRFVPQLWMWMLRSDRFLTIELTLAYLYISECKQTLTKLEDATVNGSRRAQGLERVTCVEFERFFWYLIEAWSSF